MLAFNIKIAGKYSRVVAFLQGCGGRLRLTEYIFKKSLWLKRLLAKEGSMDLWGPLRSRQLCREGAKEGADLDSEASTIYHVLQKL